MNASTPLPDLRPHKLTVDELLAFERSGALAGLPRMELLDGVLYEMSAQTSQHVVAKNELGFRLRLAVNEKFPDWAVLTEPTVRANANSAPEPDIAILTKLRVEDYYAADLVKLAVEVTVTTLSTDLHFKKALYADVGIVEYWVVEVGAARIHQFWRPVDGDYQETRIIPIGAVIESATIPGLAVATDGLI
jgi:Uma2 family endonuclease